MVFSSPIFLFFFLPIVLLLHFLVGRKFRNSLLLAASLIFYAWGEKEYSLVMLGSILLNYVFGLWIARAKISDREGRTTKLILAAAVALNLAILLFFKYANFLADNLNSILIGLSLPAIFIPPVHLPIGVSFFTFQALSYTIDVYRDKTPVQKNLFDLGLYVSLFPQLIAGPIVRYSDVAGQIRERTLSLEKYAGGARRFVIGLGKKVLIANTLGAVADRIFLTGVSQLHVTDAWLGVVCYALQIYFDFSGYSDMAIGLGRLFGFEFLENFNYPYISRSVTEFWRRWHISLSTWFRDYLYIPLGGSRRGPVRVYFNLLLVFFLCGLWHGASWNFVVWGLFHGMFLVLERLGLAKFLKRLWPPLRNLYVLVVIAAAWVFFRSDTIPHALGFLKVLFGIEHQAPYQMKVVHYMNAKVLFALGAGIMACTPNSSFAALTKAKNKMNGVFHKASEVYVFAGLSFLELVFLGAVFLCSAASLAAGTHNPFIYFRF